MADTVITPVARESEANAMGWAVAIILLLGLILFGIFIWPGMGNGVVPSTNTRNTNPGVDVNVRLPEGVTPSTMNPGTQAPTPGTQAPNSSGGVQVQ